MNSGGGSGEKIGGAEKGVKEVGVSYIKKKIVVKGGCGGYDGGSAVKNRGVSSTMHISLKQKRVIIFLFIIVMMNKNIITLICFREICIVE